MTVAAARRKADQALDQLSAVLEARAREAVLALSRRYKGKRVTFVSGMGGWSLAVGKREMTDRAVLREFASVADDYGYRAIPAPIFLSCDDGLTVHKKTDW